MREPVEVGMVLCSPDGSAGPAQPVGTTPARPDDPLVAAVNEPTQTLPALSPARLRKPPPRVAARAVIVYEDVPRRPWRLWVFTAVLVALTTGVILGQTVAFEPTYRRAANAQTAAVPPDGISSTSTTTIPAEPPWPAAEHRVTVPLGAAKTRLLEVVGASAALHVRSANLGDALLDVTTTDPSAVPRLTDTGKGLRLELVPTGKSGAAGAVVQLNATVLWTLRLTGGSLKQDIDMQAGGVAGIAIAGGTAHTVLHLPEPKGTVRLSLTGPVGELALRAKAGTALRMRLKAGADTALVDGKTRRNVKAGATLASAGWRSAKNRYDVAASGVVTSVHTSAY